MGETGPSDRSIRGTWDGASPDHRETGTIGAETERRVLVAKRGAGGRGRRHIGILASEFEAGPGGASAL